MKEILPILSSSAFGVVVTLIFNWLQNRRSTSLNYITDERKEWREKIRTISAQIELCEFQGTGEYRIEQYLTQLQMNINPYGSVYKMADYYKYDTYIWDVIKEIRAASDKEVFDKNKELLLYYISLMLKLDWERSKKEVKNFSVTRLFFVLAVVLSFGIFLYEFFALNIRNGESAWLFYIIDIFLALFAMIGIMISEDVFYGTHNIKILSLKKFVRRNLMKAIREFCGSVVLLAVFLIRIIFFFWFIPDIMLQNMTYFSDADGQQYLDVGFNDRYIPGFRAKLQEALGETVILLEEERSDQEKTEPDHAKGYDSEIEDVLDYCARVIFYVVVARDALFMVALMMFCRADSVDYRADYCIAISKGLFFRDDKKNLGDTLQMIDLVSAKLGDKSWRKQSDELLGLSISAFWQLDQELSYQINTEAGQIENLRQWEAYDQKQQCLYLIKDSIELLEKFSRSKRKKTKSSLLIRLKGNVEEIAVKLEEVSADRNHK